MMRFSLLKSLVIFLIVTVPAFAACENASNTPRPEWLNRGYSLPGYYVSVGMAERSGKTPAEQRANSENDAKQHLVEQILVTIKSLYEKNTEVANNSVNQYARSNLTSKAELMLRDLKVKEGWIDSDSQCTLYTLVIISNVSAEHARRVKLNSDRLIEMKEKLALGTNKEKFQNPQERQKYLEDAQLILNEIDFTLLSETLSKSVYTSKITDALVGVQTEVSAAKGRIALYAINPDGKISVEVINRMLDLLRAGNSKADRLMVECIATNECLDKAKDKGFEILTWLKIDSKVEVTGMGALKGTVSVSKTDYNVGNRHVINKPMNASSQVLGWGNDAINWEIAAEKAIQDLH